MNRAQRRERQKEKPAYPRRNARLGLHGAQVGTSQLIRCCLFNSLTRLWVPK